MRRFQSISRLLFNFNWRVDWTTKVLWAPFQFWTFSFPEVALLLVSTKNRDLCPTPEVRDSRTFRHSALAQSQVWQSDWLRIRNEFSAHSPKIGSSQRSRFLMLTKRSAVSGDENGFWIENMANSSWFLWIKRLRLPFFL